MNNSELWKPLYTMYGSINLDNFGTVETITTYTYDIQQNNVQIILNCKDNYNLKNI